MTFEGDAFISYAHLDNIGLGERHKGWVANLHRALEIRVAQLLGKESRIWWDPKLRGNDVFSETLVAQIQRVSALVSVVSPRYIRSEWTRRELVEFCRAAEQHGGLHICDKSRIFKVLKTPVPLEMHPPELQALLGYEFFKVEPESGRIRELDEIFGPEAEREFWIKLDDLAHDISSLLEALQAAETSATPATGEAVFLAETTSDLTAERDVVRRELQQHGYVVLPTRALPLAVQDAAAATREALARCRLSIHMFGRIYSMVPEGGTSSLLEMQNDLAIERARQGGFARLAWIPPEQDVEDERQQRVLDRLRMDQRSQQDADLLETALEDFQTVVRSWLTRAPKGGPAQAAATEARPASALLYLVYDQRDAEAVTPWADFLFEAFEVVHPSFDGGEAEIRQFHEDTLQGCDGVLIFYGAAGQAWLRRKLSEIQKSPGYGRTKALPEVAVCLIPPQTTDKEHFRTHFATVIPQWTGLSPEALQPFVDKVKARTQGSPA